MQDPPDYPDCLAPFLHRKVWQTTLAELVRLCKPPGDKTSSCVDVFVGVIGFMCKHVQQTLFETDPSTHVFVKPAATAKAFSGECLTAATAADWLPLWLEMFPPEFRVHCSEVSRL